jgi:hypothetical protein
LLERHLSDIFNGRTGQVDDILGDQDAFVIDVDVAEDDWETNYFKRNDIAAVIRRAR